MLKTLQIVHQGYFAAIFTAFIDVPHSALARLQSPWGPILRIFAGNGPLGGGVCRG
jgi:hypothetical protein